MQLYMEMILKWLITSGARVVAIIIISFVFFRVVRVVITRSKKRIGPPEKVGIERVKRTETLAGLIEKTARVVILAAALLMALQALGLNIGPLLAGAGIIGLAVGFGAQNLVKDVIGGFFILLENQINVGDVARIAGEAGLVESINLRTTTLRDLHGNVHIVPNGQIGVVTNMTKEYSRTVLDIGVAYKENVDEVIAVMKEVGDSMRSDPEFGPRILEDLEIFGLDSFGDSSINIRGRFKTLPLQQWGVAREYRRRIKAAFDERGIEIPFPHVTLYVGEGKSKGVLKVKQMQGE